MPVVADPIRVLCVDDVPDIRTVIRLIIDAEIKMRCVGCLSSANDLVEQVRRIHPRPDVVLLDATMPGESPFRAMSRLARECPQIRTIIYSGYDGDAFIDQAMEAGAWGCVCKNDPPQTIVQAVREVAAGNTFFPSAPSQR